jgi:hypothetical protein
VQIYEFFKFLSKKATAVTAWRWWRASGGSSATMDIFGLKGQTAKDKVFFINHKL